MTKTCYALWTALVLLVLGCDHVPENAPYYRLPDSAVVATVGDFHCTKGDVRQNEEILSRLLVLCGTTAKVNSVLFRRNYTTALVEHAIFAREATKRGLSLSDEGRRRQQRRFLDSLPGGTSLTYGQILSSLGKLASTFEANQQLEALSNETEDILRAEFAKKAAEASSLATNAWKSIRAGNDFDVVGRKLLEMVKNVSYDVDCEKPVGILDELSVGAISPLIATEGGLSMWKVKPGAANKKVYSRIFFSIPFPDAALDAWLEAQKKAPYVILKCTF